MPGIMEILGIYGMPGMHKISVTAEMSGMLGKCGMEYLDCLEC